MSARSASDYRGHPFPAFPKGGRVRPLVVTGDTWSEFDPRDVDLFRVHVPELPVGGVVYTSTRNFPGLAEGDAVTPEHRSVAMPYRAGTWHDCYDRAAPDVPDGVRFFFALDGADPGATATLLFEEAAE